MPQFNGTINKNRILIDIVLSKTGSIEHGERFTALIDTGATHTIVKQSITDRMNLIIRDERSINTVIGKVYSCFYEISIFVIGNSVTFNQINKNKLKCYDVSIGSALHENSRYDVLLGMDIISQCKRFLIQGNSYILET